MNSLVYIGVLWRNLLSSSPFLSFLILRIRIVFFFFRMDTSWPLDLAPALALFSLCHFSHNAKG